MCYDGDGAEVWNQRTYRAKKERKCDECALPIPRGVPYVYTFCIQEGETSYYHVHSGCDAAADFVRDKICAVEGEHGYIPLGSLGEEIGNLAEYTWVLTPEQRDDALAIGFEMESADDWDDDLHTCPAQVASWLWSIVKAEYQPTVVP